MQHSATQHNYKQQHLRLMGGIETKVIDLPANHVAQQPTFQAALRLCIDRSRVGYNRETIAEMIGLRRDSFQSMLNADYPNNRYRAFPPEKLNALYKVTGNRAPKQWLELEADGLLDCQRSVDDREAELERELQQIRLQRSLA